ncbi:MAG: imidazoleglycerol-phosphate dehydratase HisB [Anaerolineales bacterium]
MRIAFVIYDGMTALDFVGVYDPLTRLKHMGFLPELEWEICALNDPVIARSGLSFSPTFQEQSLTGFDALIVPGGIGSHKLLADTPEANEFIEWLRTAAPVPLKVSVCTGALLLGAAGFLEGIEAATHPDARADLARFGATAVTRRIVDQGSVITAAGVTAAIDLGLYLAEKWAGQEARQQIQRQMDYPAYTSALPFSSVREEAGRKASFSRKTQETEIEITLALDGSGEHDIQTGLGFLDHMLTHVAVHGLFDLRVSAQGDLQVDPHHTVEDVALALGECFFRALGDRKGVVRMGSCYVPMDEALALVAVDLSGRPYTLVDVNWHSPAVGGIPTSLFAHFLESFAVTCRCNLHARVLSGRDDHHQAEALFKGLGRALDEATRLDPRRLGRVPSTKGTLTA